ncbi:class I SAM-dependent methyltransferase [Amycolatopsis anabasis]|uniref:class I SAM-dependent methyltransferase n=1 Tax=Amycolatopsis anabasis TaxID=1840409 RepID=UPI00131E319C|nr:methyltransferase domain-containing protein [Amycolatopsis anabasis]
MNESVAVMPFYDTFGRRLVAWAGVAGGDRVLDLGSSQGSVRLPALERVGAEGAVVGIDATNAAQVELAGESFDVVLCGLALHVMVAPFRVLAEAYRVLRPGGTLAFSVPVPEAMTPPPPLDELAQRMGFTDPEYSFEEVHLLYDALDPFSRRRFRAQMQGGGSTMDASALFVKLIRP